MDQYYYCKLKVVGEDANKDINIDAIDEEGSMFDCDDWVDEGINEGWWDIIESEEDVSVRYPTYSITFRLEGLPEYPPFNAMNALCIDNDLFQAWLFFYREFIRPRENDDGFYGDDVFFHVGLYWVPPHGDGFYAEGLGPINYHKATEKQQETIDDIKRIINDPDNKELT